MPGLAKVIVVDPDARAGRQVQLGFEREGVPTRLLTVPHDPARLELSSADADEAGLVIVGGHADRGLELLRHVRALLDADHLDTPLLFAGGSVRRTDAERAGADEVLLQPAYLRDVVTIGRLLRNVASHQRSHITGSLAEMSGVLTLVRALSALGRSAVLTLMRGLRRGEVRFFEGEVTSAQVGLIHGQAALHQLLLWTDARFEFHYEDIVRRQQIPLDGEELWADAESFLAGVRDASGQLSPSVVLEQDAPRVQSLGKEIPPEVHGVLRMFDGHRMLADVLEDSPYRVFETLRVTQRAVDAGLLRVTSQGKSKATWRAVLSIEEWLVGGQAVVDATPARPRRESQSGRPRTKRRANTPISTAPPSSMPTNNKVDWGQLVPRSVGAEVGPLAGVVPAAQRSGEISLPATREAPREKLESLMDTGARERIFSRDLGMEPSIVLDDPSGRIKRASSEATRALEEDEWERVELEARRRVAETGEHAPIRSPDVHSLPTEQLPPIAATRASADEDVTEQRAKVEVLDVADAKAAAEAEAEAARIAAEAEAETKRQAALEAERSAAAEAAAPVRTTDPADLVRQLVRDETDGDLDVTVPRERVVIDPPVDEPRVLVSPEPSAPASGPRSKPTLRPMASVRPDSVPTRAKTVTGPPPALPAIPDTRAKTPTAPPSLPGLPAPRAKTPTAPPAIPEIRAKQPTAPPAPASERKRKPTNQPGDRKRAQTNPPSERGKKRTSKPHRAITTPPVIAETVPSAETAVTTVRPAPARAESPPVEEHPFVAALLVKPPTGPVGVAKSPEPAIMQPIEDEPSDGVVRPIEGETSSRSLPPPPKLDVVDDRPAAKTGEISSPGTRKEPVAEPAPEVEPSILIHDLSTIHDAVAAVATAQAAAPPTPDAKSPVQEGLVSAVRKDATGAFTKAEEDFFREGYEQEKQLHREPVLGESFDDLDDGYQPAGFWDRLRGKKKKR